MPTHVVSSSASQHPACDKSGNHDRASALLTVVEHAAHLLPAQGPIGVFIHHNTLHAFEHLPFEAAVRQGGEQFGCRSYLTEQRYRDELGKGRIRLAELHAVLREDLGSSGDELIASLASRLEVRQAMLQHPLVGGTDAEVRWAIHETDGLRRVRSDAAGLQRLRLIAATRHWVLRDLRTARELPSWIRPLFRRFNDSAIEEWSDSDWEAFALECLWAICRSGVREISPSTHFRLPIRHRDLLLAVTGGDSDALVHERLIPFCAAYLDQGVAHWPLPNRLRGFFESFCELYRDESTGGWSGYLAAEIRRLQTQQSSALESILESLDLLGVEEAEWQEYISATLLSLRGWAGMVRQVEERGDKVAVPIPGGSLLGYLAVQLLLERAALTLLAGRFGTLAQLRSELGARYPRPRPLGEEARAYPLFQLAQILGWYPDRLSRLTPADWLQLVRELEAFDVIERERIFHLAYERRFLYRTLDAVGWQAGHNLARTPQRVRPRFQAVFCIDEREESFRRHLEELAPDVETLGAAGFFSVAIYYRGLADAHFVPLCPVVVRPRHWIEEQTCDGHQGEHQRFTRLRRLFGHLSHQIHLASRTFLFGALLSAAGTLMSAPLVARVLFPRWTARFRQLVGGFTRTTPATRLTLHRDAADPGPSEGGLGYNSDEMVAAAERLLGDLGCADRFARLVLLIGHGSSSLNNPHRSAYDCGACGGSAGGPNARTMASILNDPVVRSQLAQRGIVIPSDTIFVGGGHNTCKDTVSFFDLDTIPASHRAEFDTARAQLDEACQRNAHERCRRFLSAPLTLSFSAAHRHVEMRSEDLAQTRPELGHATNAICFVGRRERTRGLFLDRRAFLVSYDPNKEDAQTTILTRTLQAIIPVCAGINLEYYFSRVDCPGWGCGSKLPHNITSLLGVMDGAASDLRTGLPWQMVELHEPVRLVLILESTVEAVEGILARVPSLAELARHRWFYLAVLDPASAAMSLYRDGVFEPYRSEVTAIPHVPTSTDWYRGWRDHLEFATIGPEE